MSEDVSDLTARRAARHEKFHAGLAELLEGARSEDPAEIAELAKALIDILETKAVEEPAVVTPSLTSWAPVTQTSEVRDEVLAALEGLDRETAASFRITDHLWPLVAEVEAIAVPRARRRASEQPIAWKVFSFGTAIGFAVAAASVFLLSLSVGYGLAGMYCGLAIFCSANYLAARLGLRRVVLWPRLAIIGTVGFGGLALTMVVAALS
jgi:hypothetical protein